MLNGENHIHDVMRKISFSRFLPSCPIVAIRQCSIVVSRRSKKKKRESRKGTKRICRNDTMVGMEQLDHGTVHEKIKERKRKGKKGRKEKGKQRGEKKNDRRPSILSHDRRPAKVYEFQKYLKYIYDDVYEIVLSVATRTFTFSFLHNFYGSVRKFTNKRQEGKIFPLFFFCFFFIYICLANVKSEKRSKKVIVDLTYILISFFLILYPLESFLFLSSCRLNLPVEFDIGDRCEG